MPVSRVELLEKDIDLLIRQDLSPESRSDVLAAFALVTLADAQTKNSAILGRVPPHVTYVDGRRGGVEAAVRPDGAIIYEFSLLEGVFAWIGELLVRSAPVGKGQHAGQYRDSFKFFADGREVDPAGGIPQADEYVFMNIQPYSRKIERGQSGQAPEGVFQVVARMAQRRFGNTAKVVFSFRSPINAAQSNIPRIGPLQVKRDTTNPDRRLRGRFVKGSHVRAGNQNERVQRQPAIIIYPR